MSLRSGADLNPEAVESGRRVSGHGIDLECRKGQQSFFESHSMN
jgi:hypothetical protein